MNMTLDQLLRAYRSRGVTPPSGFTGAQGNDYLAGNSGWGSSGMKVPWMSADSLTPRRGANSPTRTITVNRYAPQRQAVTQSMMAMSPEEGAAKFAELMGGRRAFSTRGVVSGGGGGGGGTEPQGFQTSWGTTQGAPVQNAGGGQSMFGAPNIPQNSPPPYTPPPGPTTGGYQPTYPPGMQPPGMGGGMMPPRPFGNDYLPGNPKPVQLPAAPPILGVTTYGTGQGAVVRGPDGRPILAAGGAQRPSQFGGISVAPKPPSATQQTRALRTLIGSGGVGASAYR